MNVFGMMKARMAYETQSLRLSAENMANLHTPNYKARMPTELTFDDALHPLALRKTHRNHLPPNGQQGNFKIVQDPEGQETITGNTVSHMHELQKSNAAGQNHKQMTNLWEAHLSLLTTALKS